MPTNRMDDKAVFCEALSFDSADNQQAYVKKVCGEDVGQVDRVTALLGAYARDTNFLESPASGLHQALPVAPREVPEQIGPYRIHEQIGEGGMG
ncbi:MAG: hypothetical protein ACI9DF_005102, partial [Verrucomicrobiales bacterium]